MEMFVSVVIVTMVIVTIVIVTVVIVTMAIVTMVIVTVLPFRLRFISLATQPSGSLQREPCYFTRCFLPFTRCAEGDCATTYQKVSCHQTGAISVYHIMLIYCTHGGAI